MLSERALAHFCETCGRPIAVAKRGPIRRFCSPYCQARSWRERNAEADYERSALAWATASDEYRDGTRKRARARAKALTELSRRYPKLYRSLYKKYIEEEFSGNQNEGRASLLRG